MIILKCEEYKFNTAVKINVKYLNKILSYPSYVKKELSVIYLGALLSAIRMVSLQGFLSSSTIHGLNYLAPTSGEDKKVTKILLCNLSFFVSNLLVQNIFANF